MDKHEKRAVFQTLSSFLVVCNVVRISSDREDGKIFWGFKFSISGFFQEGILLGIQNNLRFLIVISFNAFQKFLWLGNLAWDFLEVTFSSRDFFGFYLKPLGIFFSVEQRHDGCVSCTLRRINAKKIAPVLHIMFRGQLVA